MTKRNGNLASLEQSSQARAVNLRKWRAQRLHEETLPSGLEVVLRDVDLPSVMLEGDIPNTLLDSITSQEFQALNDEEAGKKVLGNNKDFNELMRQVIKAALVEPAIGETADETHILYSELSFADKMFIFNFANREAEQLRPFREGEAEPPETA